MKILAALLLFYPLLLPVWEREPFTHINTKPPPSPTFLNRQEVSTQKRFFDELRESSMKSRGALELVYSNNPVAVEVLEMLLLTEKDEMVLADIMHALDMLQHVSKCKKVSTLQTYFKHANPSLRAYAMVLYLGTGKDPAPVLKELHGERSRFVNDLVWERLIDQADACNTNELIKFLTVDDPVQRGGSSRVISIQRKDPDNIGDLKSIPNDGQVAVRATLAEGLARRENGGRNLLAVLANDKAIAVRTFVASMPAQPNRVKIHLKLSGDSDWEVRRLACSKLCGYPEAAAIEALLKRINDPAWQVREAAETSLVALKPGDPILDRLGGEYLDQDASVHAAVRILGDLNVRRFADRVHGVLKQADDVDLIRRSVKALGQFDAKKYWRSIADRAKHEAWVVRKAVGGTLGQLKIKDSYSTLRQLEQDPKLAVAVQAITSMGWIKDAAFNDVLLKNLRNVRGSANRRSAAAWSVVQINSPDKSIIKQLETICLKRIIPVNGGSKEYDSDFSRASSVWSLAALSKSRADLKSVANHVVDKLATPTELQDPTDMLSGLTLQEYARQARCFMDGKVAEKKPVPVSKPYMSITEYKKTK